MIFAEIFVSKKFKWSHPLRMYNNFVKPGTNKFLLEICIKCVTAQRIINRFNASF